MPRLHSLYVPLLALTGILMTGALSVQTRSSPTLTSPTFIPQLVPLADDISLLATDPSRILEATLKILDPKHLQWLAVQTRQHMWDTDFSFQADSRLVLGPNHCGRLETALRHGGRPGCTLVVSDGTALAHMIRHHGESPDTRSIRLPLIEGGQAAMYERDRLLAEKGCCGPFSLLADLAAKWKDVTLTTGLLNNAPALRLVGTLDSPDRSCRLYLDAQTLLPMRVEWWRERGIVLEIEYRDWQINRPLSQDQCEKEFTFDPSR